MAEVVFCLRLIIYYLLNAFELVLLVYCVASWIIRDPYNQLMRVLQTIVDPVLKPIKAALDLIPFLRELPIDLSPLLAFFLCRVIVGLI